MNAILTQAVQYVKASYQQRLRIYGILKMRLEATAKDASEYDAGIRKLAEVLKI